MTIESHPFGGVKLTGADARKFRNQVRYGRGNNAAREAAARGAVLSAELAEHGRVRLAIAAGARRAETERLGPKDARAAAKPYRPKHIGSE